MSATQTMNLSSVELTQDQFSAVSGLVYRVCGINLHEGKFGLVRARLASRLREVGLADFDTYLDRVAEDPSGRELARLVDALTTNKTGFFREPRHFDFLHQRLVPELHVPGRPLRIWSAGCSSGEEPYTLAMVLHDELGDDADVRILATDISASMIARARGAVYPEESLEPVPAMARHSHFRCTSAVRPRTYEVRAHIRSMVRFAQLNLMDAWPMAGPFDLICCRNVMIYFDQPTQQRLVDRFWDMLVPGGYFFGGHSESFAAVDHGFQYVQPAVYRKPA
ncbi:MAG TPA: protein-glutamate O-methyltransferase CheR [Longimicrobiales bacterium]|nr:protein-glutamate O-methyltransferase CheR [Longimicrobiales bacterium]